MILLLEGSVLGKRSSLCLLVGEIRLNSLAENDRYLLGLSLVPVQIPDNPILVPPILIPPTPHTLLNPILPMFLLLLPSTKLSPVLIIKKYKKRMHFYIIMMIFILATRGEVWTILEIYILTSGDRLLIQGKPLHQLPELD